MNSSRRQFLRTAALGAIVSPSLKVAAATQPAVALNGNVFAEPAMQLPLVTDAGVIVCGAGPAGVTAAITASRAGAKVRLFEWRGCLGEVWTAGLARLPAGF